VRSWLPQKTEEMDLYIALITFPVIFLGELPDKTMFANLVMAANGKPFQVWLGAAGAFAVHVAIATTVGTAVFALLPRRAVDAVVAAMFLVGAAYSWWLAGRSEEAAPVSETSGHNAVLTAFVVIFVAEWGDLTQILTANLAARYHSPASVALGALLALWATAALAIVGGQALLRFVTVATIRRVTTVVLIGLAGYTAWLALR
jgi:Ca2+/H+ antiporter, TMEM165/GDT1 family